MHEDDCVTGLEEVFGGRCTASTWPNGQSFRDDPETIDARTSDSPALKLSRNRTLNVASGGEGKPSRDAQNAAHTLSSKGTVVPPLLRVCETFEPAEGGTRADAYGHKYNFVPQIPLSVYEGSDASYVIL